MKNLKIGYDNKVMQLFNLDNCLELVKNCPKDEVVILCSNWSLNIPNYTDEELENDSLNWDLDEFETFLGCPIQVNDYNDLIADVHGIID